MILLLGRTCRNFYFGLPTDSVHPKLSEQQWLLPSRRSAEGSVQNGAVLRPLEKATAGRVIFTSASQIKVPGEGLLPYGA